MSRYLPASSFYYAGKFDTVQNQKAVAVPLKDLIREGVESSSRLPNLGKEQLLKLLKTEALDTARLGASDQQPVYHRNIDNEDKSRSPSKKRNGTETWTSVPAFHVDHSKGIEYYSELEVKPPRDKASVTIPLPAGSFETVWTVKLGDTVAVEHPACAGRATYYHGASLSNAQIRSATYKYEPFRVPWAVGEIVSIIKSCSTLEEDSLLDNDIKLEIRWFYRENEWPGNSKVSAKANETECEELLESDLYDEIVASSLLARISVYEKARDVELSKSYLGMPEVEFYCHRFWSDQRKSLVPVGGASGRIARARAQSKFIGNDAALKASLAHISAPASVALDPVTAFLMSQESTPSVPWTEAFKSVIHKLSLTDASKEAYEDGSVLVGREQERRQIMSFLRNSIKGKSIDNTKGSVFVAGPPGVGKTAVRSNFTFIYFNLTSTCPLTPFTLFLL